MLAVAYKPSKYGIKLYKTYLASSFCKYLAHTGIFFFNQQNGISAFACHSQSTDPADIKHSISHKGIQNMQTTQLQENKSTLNAYHDRTCNSEVVTA